jgi:hypothetical protein
VIAGVELELELELGLLPAAVGSSFFFGDDWVLLFLRFGAILEPGGLGSRQSSSRNQRDKRTCARRLLCQAST